MRYQLKQIYCRPWTLSGLSLKEAAQALDKSVGAIKALQHRGLANLRGAFSEEQR